MTPQATPNTLPIDALLISTCDMQGGRMPELIRSLQSVGQQVKTDAVRVVHYVLLQRATSKDGDIDLQGAHQDLRFIRIPGRLSLSRARNVILNQIRLDGLLDKSLWVGFPDDDAWYPPGLIKRITELFCATPSVGMLTCQYASTPTPVTAANGFGNFIELTRSADFVRNVSSNTLFLRADIASETGFFDERLGVGAAINGGEDLDFALRAFVLNQKKTLISPLPLVGHRDKQVWIRSTYFGGGLFALARSARRDRRLRLPFLRKIMVGAFLLIKGELNTKQFIFVMRCGAVGLKTQNPLVDRFSEPQ